MRMTVMRMRWMRNGRLGRRHCLGVLLSIVDVAGEFVDERERLPSLVAHEADGGLVDHVVEDHEEVVLEHFVGAHEVVPQITLELVALLAHVGEVDEEPRAHVPLERLDLVRIRRLIPPIIQHLYHPLTHIY